MFDLNFGFYIVVFSVSNLVKFQNLSFKKSWYVFMCVCVYICVIVRAAFEEFLRKLKKY